MRHNKHWKSEEEKIAAWLELCDFSWQLRLEGMKLEIGKADLAEETLWRELDERRYKNRLNNQKILTKLQR
ncbi:MAG: hypothetical protein AB1797_05110 [bacterium]